MMIPLKQSVRRLEIYFIKKALKENNFNQTQSAKALGLSRQGLSKKMKRYNITIETIKQLK